MTPYDVSGFVLAGGRSSRMGCDKALLELRGRPLIELAVDKLRALCREVHILSSRTELERFAPLVGDLHPGCGPLSGIEAALLHATSTRSLILPVDMPFLRVDFLHSWLEEELQLGERRVAMFTVGARPQPTLCLLHREVLPFIQQGLQEEKYKLYPVLEAAARCLAVERGVSFDAVFACSTVMDDRMFMNVNTREEYAEAQRLVDAQLPEAKGSARAS